jgi:glycerate kinase
LQIEGVKNLYNLAFGDILDDSSEINDLSITDNQDRDKILATVVSTVYEFTKRNPKAKIFIAGSTDARNRLYRMAIDKYFDELSETFDIKGANRNRCY